MRRLIKIYDTTLRDGTQGEGVSFSMEDKVRLATRLDALGIHYIEGGWPGSNPKDLRFFRRMQDVTLKQAKLAAFSMTRRAGITPEADANMQALLDAGTPVATIVGKSWDFHVTAALGTTLPENLAMIGDTIAFLRPRMDEVLFDAEHFFDGFRANRDYALATLRAAEAAGAHWLILCDTNGGTLPAALVAMIAEVKKHVRTPLGIHVHNDAECAVANSLAGVIAGARQVECTINGIGERAGNAALEEIVMALKVRRDRMPFTTGIDTTMLAGRRRRGHRPGAGHAQRLWGALRQREPRVDHPEPDLEDGARLHPRAQPTRAPRRVALRVGAGQP